jgi:hypothetical protein
MADMKDASKTKEQLISELAELRQRIGHLEESDAKHQLLCSELLNSRENYRSILEASPN